MFLIIILRGPVSACRQCQQYVFNNSSQTLNFVVPTFSLSPQSHKIQCRQMNIDFEYSNSYRGGNKWIEMVNVIALVIKTESKKEVGKREGGRNGREDALAISEMLL